MSFIDPVGRRVRGNGRIDCCIIQCWLREPGPGSVKRSIYTPTVVDLTEQEIAELKEHTRQTDVTAAIRTATTEYLRYVRRMQLKELSGKVQMQDNWGELEQAEGNADHANPGSRVA